MSERWTDDDGVEYVSCDVLCVGDYGGAGAIGEANIRSLTREYPDAVVQHGHYYSRKLWLPVSSETLAIVAGLEESYPLYDEEEHSAVESEWEETAWKDWLRADLVRTLPDDVQTFVDGWEDSALWECYREAMEAENEYAVAEQSGIYVPVNRVKGAFLEAVKDRIFKEAVAVCPELAKAPIGVLADCVADRGHDQLAEALRA